MAFVKEKISFLFTNASLINFGLIKIFLYYFIF